MTNDTEKFTSPVGQCMRCGEDHIAVQFSKLTVPIVFTEKERATHWGPCPRNGQPVLWGVYNYAEPTPESQP